MNHTQGNLKGYLCPITGQTFLSDNHTNRVQAELLHSQQSWTESARQRIAQRYGAGDRSATELAKLYARLNQESPR